MDRLPKITAGLGSIDEYIPYTQAGADELFCGYIPYAWAEKFRNILPLNRREVAFYNVQIGSESELQILRKMLEKYQIPVTLTLNSLYYIPEAYPCLADYMLACKKQGFDRFIIADHALLVYLHQQGLSDLFHLHISGELGEINHVVLEECLRLGADRMIFHRKVSISEMSHLHSMHPDLEYEAFFMNEMCHFHGGYCNSIHCDELCHMCLVPYRLSAIDSQSLKPDSDLSVVDNQSFKVNSELSAVGNQSFTADSELSKMYKMYNEQQSRNDSTPSSVPAASGCGLCALPDLADAGVSWLKIVSRGGRAEDTIRDITTAKAAINLLAEYPDTNSYQKAMKKQLFPTGCGNNCYYLNI